MTSFSRKLAAVLLVGAMIGTFVGCAQYGPKPSSRRKALKDIRTKVPKLTNLPLEKAELVLKFVALKVGKVALEKTKDPSLHALVFDQDPPPGTPVRGATAVNVKVYQFVPPEREGSSAEAK